MGRGRPAWALRAFRRATALGGEAMRPWLRRAAAAMRAGDCEEAALCYRTLLRMQPENPRAYWRLAMVYEFLGSAAAAREVCRQGVKRIPRAACLLRLYARLSLNSGRPEEALEALARAEEAGPMHCDTQYYLAMTLRQMGRLEEARSALQRAMELRPDDPKLYYALGICCQAADVQQSVGWLLQGMAVERTVQSRGAASPARRSAGK